MFEEWVVTLWAYAFVYNVKKNLSTGTRWQSVYWREFMAVDNQFVLCGALDQVSAFVFPSCWIGLLYAHISGDTLLGLVCYCNEQFVFDSP